MQEAALEYYHPKTFSSRHKIIVALSASGMKSGEIAREMGLQLATVSKILGDPRAKVLKTQLNTEFIEQLTQDTQEVIQSHTLEAANKMVSLMRGAENERVQQTSAMDILDRGGFKPKEHTVTTSFKVPPEDAKRLIDALIESRKPPEELEMIQDSSGVFRKDDDITSARK